MRIYKKTATQSKYVIHLYSEDISTLLGEDKRASAEALIDIRAMLGKMEAKNGEQSSDQGSTD